MEVEVHLAPCGPAFLSALSVPPERTPRQQEACRRPPVLLRGPPAASPVHSTQCAGAQVGSQAGLPRHSPLRGAPYGQPRQGQRWASGLLGTEGAEHGRRCLGPQHCPSPAQRPALASPARGGCRPPVATAHLTGGAPYVGDAQRSPGPVRAPARETESHRPPWGCTSSAGLRGLRVRAEGRAPRLPQTAGLEKPGTFPAWLFPENVCLPLKQTKLT